MRRLPAQRTEWPSASGPVSGLQAVKEHSAQPELLNSEDFVVYRIVKSRFSGGARRTPSVFNICRRERAILKDSGQRNAIFRLDTSLPQPYATEGLGQPHVNPSLGSRHPPILRIKIIHKDRSTKSQWKAEGTQSPDFKRCQECEWEVPAGDFGNTSPVAVGSWPGSVRTRTLQSRQIHTQVLGRTP
jgi:hypothetical protein